MKKLLLLTVLTLVSLVSISQITVEETIDYKGVSSTMYADGTSMFFNFSDSIIYLKVKYYFSEEAKSQGSISKKPMSLKQMTV